MPIFQTTPGELTRSAPKNTAGEPASEGDVVAEGDEVGGVVKDPGTPTQTEIEPATEELESPTFLTSSDARQEVKKSQISLEQAQEQLDTIRERALKLQDTVRTMGEKREARLTQQEEIKGQTEQVNQELVNYDKQLQEDFESMTSALEQYKKDSDEITSSIISNVQNQFSVRKNQMIQVYEVLKDVTNISNIRSGRSRYAPIRAASMVTQVEQEKISKLAELDVLEQQAILGARQAQQQQNWQVLTQKMQLTQNYREQKRQTILDLHANMVQEDQRLREAQQEIRTQVEFEYQEALRRAQAVSAEVAKAIRTAPSDEDKELILEEYAQRTDVNQDLLNTVVRDRIRELRLEELDIARTELGMDATRLGMANTRSIIAERGRTGGGGTVTATTEDGDTVEYDLSTTAGVKKALADGMSEADIRVELEKKKFTQGTINSLIEGAKKASAPTTPEEFKKSFVDSVQGYKELDFSRKDTKNLITNSYLGRLINKGKLPEGTTELPDKYQELINESIDEVYGEKRNIFQKAAVGVYKGLSGN